MRHIKITVYADAKKEQVIESGERLSVFVKEPAQQNRANKRVCEVVAAHIGAPAGAVRIIAGHHSPRKTLEVIDRANP